MIQLFRIVILSICLMVFCHSKSLTSENETIETEAKANGMLKALGSLSK